MKGVVRELLSSCFTSAPLEVRNGSGGRIHLQAFLGLAPPAEIKVFTPPITKANQPQTFNMPNGTVLWLIIDNDLPTQLDQISVSFDAGQSYKTIPKGHSISPVFNTVLSQETILSVAHGKCSF